MVKGENYLRLFTPRLLSTLSDNKRAFLLFIIKWINVKKMQNIACDLIIKLVTCKHLLTIKLSNYEKVTALCMGCDSICGLW